MPTLRFCLYLCSAWARRSWRVGSAAPVSPVAVGWPLLLLGPAMPAAAGACTRFIDISDRILAHLLPGHNTSPPGQSQFKHLSHGECRGR